MPWKPSVWGFAKFVFQRLESPLNLTTHFPWLSLSLFGFSITEEPGQMISYLQIGPCCKNPNAACDSVSDDIYFNGPESYVSRSEFKMTVNYLSTQTHGQLKWQ